VEVVDAGKGEVEIGLWPNARTVPAVVLDPFLGSGTTLEVAARLGRHGVGIELSEEYCKLSVERLEKPIQREFAL